MALITTAGAAVVPPSPPALMPSGWVGEIAEVLSPTNPLGIKAGGEGGTTAAPAVVISAIVDALRDYGVRDIKMPATPYNIWQTIEDAKVAGRTGKQKSSRRYRERIGKS